MPAPNQETPINTVLCDISVDYAPDIQLTDVNNISEEISELHIKVLESFCRRLGSVIVTPQETTKTLGQIANYDPILKNRLNNEFVFIGPCGVRNKAGNLFNNGISIWEIQPPNYAQESS